MPFRPIDDVSGAFKEAYVYNFRVTSIYAARNMSRKADQNGFKRFAKICWRVNWNTNRNRPDLTRKNDHWAIEWVWESRWVERMVSAWPRRKKWTVHAAATTISTELISICTTETARRQ